jgi:anaerobic magnesium-protoporphyrin IX monomethyl ester cyclase
LTATTSGIVAAAELARRIKAAKPDTTTVIGGCHASALPSETLQEFPGFDLAAIGEGEETLVDILRHREVDVAGPWSIPGTAVRDGHDTAVRLAAPRPVLADLDALPLPAWSLLPGFPRAFRPSPARLLRWPCASVVLTRGCPNQCMFCDRSVFGNRCRAYSPAYAVRLVNDLRQNHGVRELLIEDDTFVVSRKRVQEFCERLIAERVDVTWSCLGRADAVAPELLRLMRRAGCWHVSYGIESGDAAILAAMHKRLDVEQIRQAVQWTCEAGLRSKGFFIVGFPGETEESLRKSRELANSLPLDDITVMQMTPFPGSELYRTAEQYGTFERDWRKMNVLETVFVPHGLSREDLDAARSRMLREFYMRPRVLRRQMTRVLKHPRLIPATLQAFNSFRKATRERT